MQPGVGFLVERSLVDPRTRSAEPINKDGGKSLFPEELRRHHHWVELELAPSSSLLLLLLALPALVLPRPRRRAAISLGRWRLRCAVALALLLLDLCLAPALLPATLQQLRPKAPSSTASTRWSSGLDVLLILLSPGAPRPWQFGTGSACMLVNHAKGETVWLKHKFATAIRSWSAERGCDYTQLLPPTFFLHPPPELRVSSQPEQLNRSAGEEVATLDDCTLLFTRHATPPRAAGRGGNLTAAVWFQKDALRGSHGRGIRVLTTAMLRRRWGVRPGHEARRCIEIRRGVRSTKHVLAGQIVIQPAIARPLLLLGRRKFDVRLYILIADRRPFSAWLSDGYLRFCDKPTSEGDLATAAHIDNIDVAPQEMRHSRQEHYFEHAHLRQLLASAEAEGILRPLGLSAAQATARLLRRLLRRPFTEYYTGCYTDSLTLTITPTLTPTLTLAVTPTLTLAATPTLTMIAAAAQAATTCHTSVPSPGLRDHAAAHTRGLRSDDACNGARRAAGRWRAARAVAPARGRYPD